MRAPSSWWHSEGELTPRLLAPPCISAAALSPWGRAQHGPTSSRSTGPLRTRTSHHPVLATLRKKTLSNVSGCPFWVALNMGHLLKRLKARARSTTSSSSRTSLVAQQARMCVLCCPSQVALNMGHFLKELKAVLGAVGGGEKSYLEEEDEELFDSASLAGQPSSAAEP